MLFVLIFSSNCSIVFYTGDGDGDGVGGEAESVDGIGSAKRELVRMQDMYVTMLWKYMVYLYGYNQAALRFSSMIKSVIDMFHRVEELPASPAHRKMISQVAAPTEYSTTTQFGPCEA